MSPASAPPPPADKTDRNGHESGRSQVDPRQLQSFGEFYAFYLREHSNRTCRRLHFTGTSLSLIFLIALVATGHFWYLIAAFASGYGLAWFGHFAFEKNKPASFKRPLYSFRGDWVMWRDMLTGKIKF